jgi:hypothetical protein
VCLCVEKFGAYNKKILLNLYKIMAIPTLIYEFESLYLLKQDERRNDAAEIEYLRSLPEYAL